MRTDKNSAFGANFARVVYPSLSASWVASEEEFFPKVPALSSLRLRAAVGSAGQNPGYLAAEQYYRPVTVDHPGRGRAGVHDRRRGQQQPQAGEVHGA